MITQTKNTYHIVLASWETHRVIPHDIRADLLEEVLDCVEKESELGHALVAAIANA